MGRCPTTDLPKHDGGELTVLHAARFAQDRQEIADQGVRLLLKLLEQRLGRGADRIIRLHEAGDEGLERGTSREDRGDIHDGLARSAFQPGRKHHPTPMFKFK